MVIGRQWLADPDLVKKAMNGQHDRIRPCVGCNALCLDAAQAGKDIGCIGNFECNREKELRNADGKFPSEVKSAHPEKILVIGAGPSGMEFARVSALRGHKVTIWEKRDRTIGLSLFAATPPRRYDIRYLGQWLERECRALGVEIILNKEGDLIEIDIPRRVLAIVGIKGDRKSPEEIDAILAQRKTDWRPKPRKYKNGVLRMFSEHAASPMKGAYLEY